MFDFIARTTPERAFSQLIIELSSAPTNNEFVDSELPFAGSVFV